MPNMTNYSYDQLKNVMPDYIDIEVTTHKFEEIINSYLLKNRPVSQPFLINFSGIPGAGKTTWCKMVSEVMANVIYISFDEIMKNQKLPYKTEARKDANKAFERWELPIKIAGYELLRRAVKRRYNILFEHSSSIPQHVELFKWIISEGYDVHFRYIDVDIDEAKERVIKRNEVAGRFFPIELIDERDVALRKLLPQYEEICTTYKQIGQC